MNALKENKTVVRSWRTSRHKTLRESKNEKFIFGEKNSIHIIDLTQTVEFIKSFVQVHKDFKGENYLLFPLKQASEQISDLAKEIGQFYVNQMVRRNAYQLEYNSKSNQEIKKLDNQLSKENLGLQRKKFKIWKRKRKLQRSLGGISEMKRNRT